MILHARRVFVIENVLETVYEQLHDHFARFSRIELAFLLHYVFPILDCAEDRGVGAGTADAFGLQSLDQARLIVARRRLGKMLRRTKLPDRELLAFPELR